MPISRSSFVFVAELVRKNSAIQLASGKEYLVESRLQPLAKLAGFTGPGAVDSYVNSVRQSLDLQAVQDITDALTTNETSFFRDATPFAELKRVILPALEEQGIGPLGLKVWSAACSTGQEPYSIAMTLLDLPKPLPFKIVATDLSRAVLAQAKNGLYTQLEVNRGLPAPMLVKYFKRAGRGWQVDSQLQQRIFFQQHNLLDNPPVGGPFHIVFIRNVLIYFDPSTKREVLRRVARVMVPGGFLVLGAAENTMGMDPVWNRVEGVKGAIYRLNGGGVR